MEISLRITPQDIRRFFRGLLILELFFVISHCLSLFSQVPITLKEFFSLDSATSLASWFSATQLLAVACLAFIQARWANPHRLMTRSFLLGMGSIFLFLSIDEALEVHEKVTLVLKQFEWLPRFRGNHGMWIPIYGLLSLGVLAKVQKRLLKLARAYPIACRYVAAGVVIVLFGGVALEVVSYQLGLRETSAGWYGVQVMVEEACEMVGVTSVLYGAVRLFLLGMMGQSSFMGSRPQSWPSSSDAEMGRSSSGL